jgi:hypothetical protein
VETTVEGTITDHRERVVEIIITSLPLILLVIPHLEITKTGVEITASSITILLPRMAELDRVALQTIIEGAPLAAMEVLRMTIEEVMLTTPLLIEVGTMMIEREIASTWTRMTSVMIKVEEAMTITSIRLHQLQEPAINQEMAATATITLN